MGTSSYYFVIKKFKKMKINNLYWVFAAIITITVYSACEKEEFKSTDKGSIVFEFDNVAGGQDLQLNTGNYTNAAGENITFSLFQYFISNIKLKTEDGSEYVVPQNESYFLIQEHKEETHKVVLNNVPAGNYTSVSFVIGVDSLRNTMAPADRTGVLDVAAFTGEENMYWAWNSGYIFVKTEGVSPQAPVGNDGQRRFRYHIGGFGGYSSATINNIKTKSLSFGNEVAKVRKDTKPEVHLTADILKLFSGNQNISIAANPTVMFSPFSVNVANNYVDMFAFDHIHN
jgi:hypothetical protein